MRRGPMSGPRMLPPSSAPAAVVDQAMKAIAKARTPWAEPVEIDKHRTNIPSGLTRHRPGRNPCHATGVRSGVALALALHITPAERDRHRPVASSCQYPSGTQRSRCRSIRSGSVRIDHNQIAHRRSRANFVR